MTPYAPAQGGIDLGLGNITEGIQNAQQYTGRFTPLTSGHTTGGLSSFAQLLGNVPSTYGQSALQTGDYIQNKVMSGGYKAPVYDPQQAIDAAVRPVVEKYSENLLPNLGAFFTSNGAYQGTAPGGTANVAGDVMARNLTREISQAAGEQTYNAAALNSQNLFQGNAAENEALGALPQLYAGGIASASLFPQLQGQVGQLDESIAGRDITEALTASNYGNMFESSVYGPLLQMLVGAGSQFGKTTQTNIQYQDPITQALSAIIPLASIAAAPFTGGASLAGLGAMGAVGGSGFANPFPSGQSAAPFAQAILNRA